MSIQHTPDEDSLQAGHELRDVQPRGVLMLAAGLIVVAIVVHVLLWWLFGVYERAAGRQDPPVSPLAGEVQPPPGPQLQSEPRRDFQQFQRNEMQWLESYGWIDEEHKVVRIPVARAMELLAERGWPEPSASQPTEEQPDSDTQRSPDAERRPSEPPPARRE